MMHVLVRSSLAAMAAASAISLSGVASSQTQAALETSPTRPMTAERGAWLKGRCSQLVAYFDRYGVGRGENSDGPRNHTRIGAAIDCERAGYRRGIDTMAALLQRKAFGIPKPGTPAIEPQDIEAPDVTNPTRP
jgi:hypothetical protein